MDNLFENDMVDAARAQCTPQQLDEYKTKGERCYNQIDFTVPNPQSSQNKLMATIIATWIKSGVDTNELSREEKDVYDKLYVIRQIQDPTLPPFF